MKKITPFFLLLALLFSFNYSTIHASNGTQSGGTGTQSGGTGTQSGGTGTQSGDTTLIGQNGLPLKLDNPFKGGNTLDALLKTIIENIIIPIGAVLVVLAFIYSGFLFVSAQGNEEQIKKAKRALLYTAVGAVILLGSWVIMQLLRESVNQLLT